jgi:hypothetical protein
LKTVSQDVFKPKRLGVDGGARDPNQLGCDPVLFANANDEIASRGIRERGNIGEELALRSVVALDQLLELEPAALTRLLDNEHLQVFELKPIQRNVDQGHEPF